MFCQLFRARNENTSSPRPTFRPTLEALETREVPTGGITNPIVQQVQAAIQEINATLPLLQNNINLGNAKNGVAEFKIIANDLNVLSANATKFAPPSRLQIDITQVQTGVQLFQDGALLIQLGDQNDGVIVRQNAFNAIFNGLGDFLNMQAGFSSGNLNLP